MSFSIGSRSVLISWSGLLLFPMLAPLAWAEPTQEELEAASLLASRATFGMSYDQIVEMAEQGLDEWLDEQLNMECTSFVKWEEDMVKMYEDGEFDEFIDIFDINVEVDNPAWNVVSEFGGPINTIWYMAVRYGKDQLCQRVAWALSQIFVINTETVEKYPYSHTSYYDILTRNALGNYRELIEDVTYSAQMGIFLSHVNNSRSRPEKNRFPDENYARELMQLFSIGLFELNVDGSFKTDSSENWIPTYDGDGITNLARVMTGFAFDGENAQFDNGNYGDLEWHLPMEIMEYHHDKEEKVILGDITIPAGQKGFEDVEDALDAIHEHDNVGPFIGRQLIQRLVTSNPEPEYVQRVAEAFNDDGQGVRGNLKHVVRTILTDPEATTPSQPDHFGKLREPMLRLMNLHRMFPTVVVGDERGLTKPFYTPSFFPRNQYPLNAPSVFNFYSPFHSPKGDLSDNELVAPEFQIFNMLTSIDLSNVIWDRLVGDEIEQQEGRLIDKPWRTWFHAYDYQNEEGNIVWWHPLLNHDISDYVELADSPSDLVDRLDLVMAHGTLDSETRRQFIHRIGQIPVNADDGESDHRLRVLFAIWYMSFLPEYMVESY